MQKIDINLSTQRRATTRMPHIIAFALLFLAVIYSWYSMDVYAGNRARIEAYRQRLAALESRSGHGRGLETAGASEEELKSLKKEAGFINDAIRMETFSWTGLLTGLEECVPPDVSVVQLSPDFREGKVAISGIAKSTREILSFVDRLGGSSHFKDVFLLRHSEEQAGHSGMDAQGARQGFVYFNISAAYQTGSTL